MHPVVAIVGRPNVGKSTLFNRLARKNAAITHDRPGVTRDRIRVEASLSGRAVSLIDTGGMELSDAEGMDLEVLRQAEAAIAEAHVLLLVVDGREGLNPLDEQAAAMLRAGGKPVLLVVNKVDGPEREGVLTAEFHALGMELQAVSAEHGFALNTLRERVAAMLPEEAEEALPAEKPELRLAMLGRPNAGKSSLINALVGEDRLIVSDVAGTTRDAVDVAFERGGLRCVFVDTAGVRKRTRIDDGVEKYSVQKALSSARRADAALLVIDAVGGLGMQDKKLISFLDKEKTAFIVLVNKVDLLSPKELSELKKDISYALKICPHVPVLYVSAVSRRSLKKILPLAAEVKRECGIRVGTGELNRSMRAVLDKHQAPVVKRRRARFYYLTQSEETPPTFVFFVNDPERVKPSYARYLENGLRRMLGIKAAPMRLLFRSSHKPKE